MRQHREEWTLQPHGAVVTDMEVSNSDNEESVMPLLIYPEESNNKEDTPCESLSEPTSADLTLEPGPPSKNLPRN